MNSHYRVPSLFIGHGSPTNALDKTNYSSDLIKLGKSFSNIQNIAVISAHFETLNSIQITSSPIPKVIYDFYGFPDELYELRYDCPGNPELAIEIYSLLASNGFSAQLNPNRGLDHGAWIPLRLLIPEAIYPVIQISLPSPRKPMELIKIGKILSNLRSKGVLLIGSGNLIHNLPHVMHQIQLGIIRPQDLAKQVQSEEWALKADNWIKERLNKKDLDALINASQVMPDFSKAAPTTEHFDPIYVILGSMFIGENIHYFHESIQAGSISMRSLSIES